MILCGPNFVMNRTKTYNLASLIFGKLPYLVSDRNILKTDIVYACNLQFRRTSNHGKKFAKLNKTSCSGIVH